MSTKRWNLIAYSLAAALWGYFLFFVPTFDLDESLYRRVAEEMKWSGLFSPAWWHPVWDGDVLFHKPPILYWLIATISHFIDGAQAPVSVFSARLPSVLAGTGILFSLSRVSKRWRLREGHLAPLFFLCAIFPMITTSSVIYDILQSWCLMPALILSTEFFLRDRSFPFGKCALWAVSLFLATAVKGLNGLLIPSFAFAVQTVILCWLSTQEVSFAPVLRKNTSSFKTFISIGVDYTLKVFLPAAILSALYYWVLDLKMGRAFTHEFFWVQHFGRSSEAMEAHGGSILYHPATVFIGGGFLASCILYRARELFAQYTRIGFPLTYTLSFIFVFSFSATKLPHYTWPVWPALALLAALLNETASRAVMEESTLRSMFTKTIAALPLAVFIMLCLLLAITPPTFFEGFALKGNVQWIIPFFQEIHPLQRLLLLLAASGFGVLIWKSREWLMRPALAASCSVGSVLCLSLGLMPTVKSIMVAPFYDIAESVKKQNPKPEECIRYTGPHSPTLSLALGRELRHNRCEPASVVYMIAPVWKVHECEERKFPLVDQKRYLHLCVKPGHGSVPALQK